MSRGFPPYPIEAAPAPAGVARRPPSTLRAIRRGALAMIITLLAAPIQAALILLPGPGKRTLPRLYWAAVRSALGIRVRVVGTVARAEGRPIIFASNHSSWLDILVLGGSLEACFIAKAEVATWPVISLVARLGRSVYVSRRVKDTGRERDDMRARLEEGDSLILFPEGTSSDGCRVLPFRSPFFSVAEPRDGVRPIVQPVCVVYDRLDGLPMGRETRPACAWYGAMGLGGHFLGLARYRGIRVTILLHPAVEPEAFPSRKALSQTVWQTIAESSAQLRQNRPVSAFA